MAGVCVSVTVLKRSRLDGLNDAADDAAAADVDGDGGDEFGTSDGIIKL